MAGWDHRLDEHGFGWIPGQGGLVCCGSWGHKESDTTEQLNWTELSGSLPTLVMVILLWVVIYQLLEYCCHLES